MGQEEGRWRIDTGISPHGKTPRLQLAQYCTPSMIKNVCPSASQVVDTVLLKTTYLKYALIISWDEIGTAFNSLNQREMQISPARIIA